MIKFKFVLIGLLLSLGVSGQNFFWSHNAYESIKYGYLYNAFAIDNSSPITNTGWHVATKSEIDSLQSYLSGIYTYIGKSLATTTGWSSSVVTGAIGNTDFPSERNATKFNAKPSGIRAVGSGSFLSDLDRCYAWSSTNESSSSKYIIRLNYNYGGVTNTFALNTAGISIRIVKDSTTLSDGESSIYVGNDGTIYRTICIGTKEWLADNLAETKYRDGTSIPEVTDNTTWANLTTGARCVYDNDESNR